MNTFQLKLCKILLSTICIVIICIIIINRFMSGSDNKTLSKTGFYFDTVITITIYSNNEEILDNCFKMCDRYENLFSNTIPDSDISQINTNSKKGIYTTVCDETLELINYGLKYSDMSKGVFDITIGRLTSLWNFSDNKDGVLPDSYDIMSAVSNIGWEQIKIRGNDILISNPDASIDAGGIAKGYIADKIKEYLTDNGVKRGIINLGGNVLLIGDKPDKTGYNIGIQRPFGNDGDISVIINGKDISIVTSGIYERYFYNDNNIYHHILDTKTGYPIKNNLYSVTIISDSSAEGDALSTTVFALGLENGKKYIESLDNVEAVFIDDKENITITSGLIMENNTITGRSALN